MSKELSEETKYEFNVFARQLNKDLTNLMEYLRQQDKDNKPILYVGRHLKKVILPYDEYQKMCQRLESIDNSKPSEALENLRQQAIAFEHSKLAIKVANGNYNTIKPALLKAQEQEKLLEIINKKAVSLFWLKGSKTVEAYNYAIDLGDNEYRKLTQKEFDLLKRYFK